MVLAICRNPMPFAFNSLMVSITRCSVWWVTTTPDLTRFPNRSRPVWPCGLCDSLTGISNRINAFLTASLEEQICSEIWANDSPSTTYFCWRKTLFLKRGVWTKPIQSTISSGGTSRTGCNVAIPPKMPVTLKGSAAFLF